MNVFNVFVKFLDQIDTIQVRLAKLIEEKGRLRFWKESPITKIKYTITILKKKMDPRGLGPSPGFVLVVRNYYYYYFAFVFNTKTVGIIKDMKKREMCYVSCNL